MKLLTQEILKVLPKIYATEHVPLEQRIVVCKFFTPWSNWHWYVFEGDFVKEEGKVIDVELFGLVSGYEKELGYFSLSELESVRGPWGLRIERDIAVFKKPLKRVLQLDGIRMPSWAA